VVNEQPKQLDELKNDFIATSSARCRPRSARSTSFSKTIRTWRRSSAANFSASSSRKSERLNQVAANLISNAVKFCDLDRGTADIEAEVRGGSFLVTVSDNGQGVASEERKKIFDKFQQARADDGSSR
jgi:signal transduction histidine kinase